MVGLLLALASAAPTALRADEPVAGSLAGTVSDPTGAVLAGVSVEARPEGGGRAVAAVTSVAGEYRIEGLAAGAWEVSFYLPSFASSVAHDVAVRPGAQTRLDTRLRLRLTTQVIVTARATFRDLSSAASGEELLGVASTASSGVVAASEIEIARSRGPATSRSACRG